MSNITEQFIKDIDRHEMTVIRDDGVNRHIRFKRQGTMCMHFDLITWPGYLCYTGDMGTYVFQRLHDMFQFFRRDEGERQYRIDYRYWAEKVEASDKGDGLERFSPDKFRANVRDWFEQRTEDAEEWPEEVKEELWQRIKDEVLYALDDTGEQGAYAAMRDFDHNKRWFFQDWESSSREYTHRFLWCCHALAWAINTYDSVKQSAEVAA